MEFSNIRIQWRTSFCNPICIFLSCLSYRIGKKAPLICTSFRAEHLRLHSLDPWTLQSAVSCYSQSHVENILILGMLLLQGVLLDCTKLMTHQISSFPDPQGQRSAAKSHPPVWIALDEVKDPVSTPEFATGRNAYWRMFDTLGKSWAPTSSSDGQFCTD